MLDSFLKIKRNHFREEISFNGNFNVLAYDSEIDKNIWDTMVYGFDNIGEYETYVRFANSDIDTILVNYSFSTALDGCTGRDYCADITSAYYNGTLVYSKEMAVPDFVHIIKTEDNTSVELK